MPTSYQSPMRGDANGHATHSQSAASNISPGTATVADVLNAKGRDTYAVRPQDTLGDAVKLLRDKRIGALLATDATGTLLGILSERDIVRKLADAPGQTLPQTVEAVMTREVETCAPDDTLISVLKRMTAGRFRHMPVMENGTLAGMVTIGDVVNYRLTALEHEALQLKQLIVG